MILASGEVGFLVTSIAIVCAFAIYIGWCTLQSYRKLGAVSNDQAMSFYFFKGGFSNLVVSLSLFATIFSSVSYLGGPEEIIRNGIAFLCVIPGYFVAMWGINRWIIPKMWSLSEGSLFSHVEKRFGRPSQVASILFYSFLRLSWMAILIHVTGKSICFMYGLDPSYGMLISLGLALVAIGYSTFGGLRAVIQTDALQAVAMVLGIIAVILSAAFFLDDFSWLTKFDYAHWKSQPIISFSPEIRLSYIGQMSMTVVWYVSLYLGDQVTFQRIKTSRSLEDVKTALLKKSIIASFFNVSVTLASMALMAFFLSNPHHGVDHAFFDRSAQRVLPKFLSMDLVPGLSGLVLVGLISAAMSSVDSALNTLGLSFQQLGFLQKNEWLGPRKLNLCLGGFVVGCVLLVPFLSGSILEICSKLTLQLHIACMGFFLFYFWFPRVHTSAVLPGIILGLATSLFLTYGGQAFLFGKDFITFQWLPLTGIAVQVMSVLLINVLWKNFFLGFRLNRSALRLER